MRRAVVLVAVVTLLAAAGCSGESGGDQFSVPAIGPADVEVDSPELREAKADAGIEDCPEVDGGAVAGGFPEISLPCLGGGPSVDLASLRGPLVLNVWAQWCAPCRNEMPELEAFHQAHGDEVPLVGIDYQDPQTDDAMAFLTETGATYPQLADPGASIDTVPQIPRRRLPTTILVDSSGRIAHAESVVIDSPDQLVEMVREHLGVEL